MFRSEWVNGKKLAELRFRKGFSQDDIARAVGRAKGTITRYEGLEAVGMDPDIFRALAKAMQITDEELRRLVGTKSAPARGKKMSAFWILRLPIDLRAEVEAVSPGSADSYAEQSIRTAVKVKRDELARLAKGAKQTVPLRRGGEGAADGRIAPRPTPRRTRHAANAGPSP